MKLTDKIIEKVGVDKLLHFLVAMCISLIVLHTGIVWLEVSVISTLVILSIVKEVKWDEEPDWWDVGAALLGISASTCIFLI